MNITINHYSQQTHIAHSFKNTLNMHQGQLYPEPLKNVLIYNLYNFKFEFIQIIFSDHRGIKQAVNNKKTAGKPPNIYKCKNILLNNP